VICPTVSVTGGWENQPAKRRKLLARIQLFRSAHQLSGAHIVGRFMIPKTRENLVAPMVEQELLIFG